MPDNRHCFGCDCAGSLFVCIFQARLEAGDTYLGMDENGDWISGPLIIVETGAPSEAELFPSYGQLYAWAIAEKYDIHGNIVILVCILIVTVILIIDIVFPDFYFLLHYSLAVKGGAEPSDWYRTWQRIGQVIMGIIIIICMMLSFKNP